MEMFIGNYFYYKNSIFRDVYTIFWDNNEKKNIIIFTKY